jgi:hypothetical protein
LCEKCHQPGSSHDSKYAGTHKDTVGFDCASCHLNVTKAANGGFNNRSHSFEVKNAYTDVTGCKVCHDENAVHSKNFSEYGIHGIVTCEACHDKTVARNSSGYVVNVSAGMDAGLYKDTSTNKWTTYKVSHNLPATWPLHNISKSVDCNKCHGARSVYSGAIAPNLTSGGSTFYTFDQLISGYKLFKIDINPNPVLYARNLLFTSPGGMPGVTKVQKYDEPNQTWVSYEYLVSKGIYYPDPGNFTILKNDFVFIKGNASTNGTIYTIPGTK